MIIDNEEVYQYKHNKNYYITKSGKIYSSYIKGGQGKTDISSLHLLSYSTDRDGYYRVVLSKNGKRQYKKVHTIIAEQFIHDVPTGMVVNHIDGNIHNNNIINLEIVTPSENTVHAHLTGLTTREIKVNVKYNNKDYYFNSLKECTDFFPEIGRNYLKQIRNNTVTFSNVLFVKSFENEICNINCFYNGKIFKTFRMMKDADSYFGVKRGSTSAAIKYNEYRKKVNKYIITFPNVSTIESPI